MSVQTLAPDSSTEEILKVMEQDGAAIIADLASPDLVKRMTEQVMPFIDSTRMGPDSFTGVKTQRTGALVARTPACRELVMDAKVLDAANQFLAPYTNKILLHLTQTIYIHPGNPAQPLHRDRLAWGDYIPKSIEPQFNTIWALTDFTCENGATRCVPGSHKWDWDKRAEPEQTVQAEMSAGSVFLYSGSVLHSGGENRSDTARLGLNLTYTLSWLRQEENQYLSCPPHIAKKLAPELQDLLGYTQGNYALGYYSDPENQNPESGILSPETILGRKPISEYSSISGEGEELKLDAEQL